MSSKGDELEEGEVGGEGDENERDEVTLSGAISSPISNKKRKKGKKEGKKVKKRRVEGKDKASPKKNNSGVVLLALAMALNVDPNSPHDHNNPITKLRLLRQEANKRKHEFQARKEQLKSNPGETQPTAHVKTFTKIICKFWMEGLCVKGSNCPFSHDAVPNKTAAEARVLEPCRYFINGMCIKGDACLYSHDLSKFPCPFLSKKCTKKNCPFSHEVLDEVVVQ